LENSTFNPVGVISAKVIREKRYEKRNRKKIREQKKKMEIQIN
jgi:hypothetical protein